jgi:maltooligosyltrehalose trehalohydrolase
VNFLQNHDQIANSADGRRVHELASAGEWRALTALLLLMPGTALLFQGQEFRASAPFLFFADHNPKLAPKVHAGRREFLSQFASAATPEVQALIADPADEQTFLRSKLDPNERAKHADALRLHHDLIRLSREDPVFAQQDAKNLHGAVLSDDALVLRWFAADGDDRLLLVNLGLDLHIATAPEPLLAPPRGQRWCMIWTSGDPLYGGDGTAEPEREDGWLVPGHEAIVLAPASASPATT